MTKLYTKVLSGQASAQRAQTGRIGRRWYWLDGFTIKEGYSSEHMALRDLCARVNAQGFALVSRLKGSRW